MNIANKLLSLSCGLLSFYAFSTEEVTITNKTNNEYICAFVYVSMSGSVSMGPNFFEIEPNRTIVEQMPKKSFTGDSRYLFVTSNLNMTAANLAKSSDWIKNKSEDANLIQIGRGGLLGNKKNVITITATPGSRKPNLSAETV